MQDKEFDQLFKGQFEEAEIQPSANLWDAIEAGITPAPKRRVLPGWWMAAAVALVAMSVGLLFNKTEKIQLQGTAALVDKKVTPSIEEPVQIENQVIASQPLVIEKKESTVVDRQLDKRAVLSSEEKSLVAVQPNVTLSHPLHIENETLAKVAVGSIQETSNTDIVIASTDLPVNTGDAIINENDQAEHTRIRNVGDLINFVVDKVDKREQKFLQFKTDSDDNSSLIAINIGPFKLNPRKHK